jgi:hypothetical protein
MIAHDTVVGDCALRDFDPAMTELGQTLPPRSVPACLLPPNADIALLAGRAAPRGRASATGQRFGGCFRRACRPMRLCADPPAHVAMTMRNCEHAAALATDSRELRWPSCFTRHSRQASGCVSVSVPVAAAQIAVDNDTFIAVLRSDYISDADVALGNSSHQARAAQCQDFFIVLLPLVQPRRQTPLVRRRSAPSAEAAR